MSIARNKMKEALLEWVVPILNAKGFIGKFPHYYRVNKNQTDLLLFQFTYFDEAFCVNLAKCPKIGVHLSDGTILPPEQVQAFHCREKLSLGAQSQESNHWFKYNPRPVELRDKDKYPFITMYKESLLKYKLIADDIIRMINILGEEWWGEPLQSEEDNVIINKFFLETQKLMGY